MDAEFRQYQGFVDKITSETSRDTTAFIDRIIELESGDVPLNFARMDTAINGFAGEAGEINDLWKKIKYHGKPWNEENRDKMISEASDMLWYYAKFLEELGVPLSEVIDFNIDKLVARYPGGEFSIQKSENRDELGWIDEALDQEETSQ